MRLAGLETGPEGTFLSRVRTLCSRAAGLGGRLVAWTGRGMALLWDDDSIEQAILLASSIQEEALTAARAWAGGIAEGNLELLSPAAARVPARGGMPAIHLASGEALTSAMALARAARPGEVIVDGDMGVVRAGKLTLLGPGPAADTNSRARGFRLYLADPWRREGPAEFADASPPEVALAGPRDAAAPSEAREPLVQVRRARAAAEKAPAAVRCQASLALAMTLAQSGRAEEALLDALDALARAREGHDPKASAACMALIAKLYAGAGRQAEAAALLKG
jgi:hypothetical protein